MGRDIRIAVRVDRKTYDDLKKLAADNNRSMSNLAFVAIKAGIEFYKSRKVDVEGEGLDKMWPAV